MATQSSFSVATIDLLMQRIALVCDKHRVTLGSPAELAGFLTALEHDKLLAMDFWAVIGGMSVEPSRASDDLSILSKSANAQSEETQEQILEAIVRVITGVSVSEMICAGGQSRQAMEDLKHLMDGRDKPSSSMAVALAETHTAEASTAWAVGYKYRNTPELQLGQLQSSQSQPNESSTDKKKVENQGFAMTQGSRRGAHDGIATDGADPVPPRSYHEDNDIRRVLFGEESLDSGEAAAPSRSGVMKLVKLGASWIESGQLVRVIASALLIVAVSAVTIHIHNTDALPSYTGSLKEMLSGLETAENVSNDNADEAKGTAQPMKSRGGSGRHQQKTHPAKPLDTSADAVAKPKAPETGDAEGDSNPVGEKLPVAYETAPDRSTGDDADAARSGPIEVSPEVMKENLIPLAGSGSSFAAGLQQGKSRVVMQVVISKLGIVESLRVTEGDSALRAAATRAVSTWRYRPYLVNGVPVTVKTIVTVNFMMDS
jgi:Gram-negative bacterial TonB protein C-terminal